MTKSLSSNPPLSRRYELNFNFFYLTLMLMIATRSLLGQSSLECGKLPQHQAISTNPDSIVYDRFGNTYDVYPAWNSGLSLPCSNSGYYHLESSASLTTDIEDALCLIFEEMSIQFPRRINYNACGDVIPQEDVNILIRPFHGGPSNIGAASSLIFASTAANCTQNGPIETGRFYQKINGGKVKKSIVLFYDGFLDINLDINWNFNFQNGPTQSQIDFRTAIKHEILHLMGIGSNINMDGSAFNGYYTIYDKYLGAIPYFNNSNNFQNLISSNCK